MSASLINWIIIIINLVKNFPCSQHRNQKKMVEVDPAIIAA